MSTEKLLSCPYQTTLEILVRKSFQKNTPTHKNFRWIITQFAWVGNSSPKVFIINLSFVIFYEMGLPEFEFLNFITSKILSKNFLPKKNFNFRSKIYFLSNQMINQIKNLAGGFSIGRLHSYVF